MKVILFHLCCEGSMHTFSKELEPHHPPKVNQRRTIHQGGEEKVTASTKTLMTLVTCPRPTRSHRLHVANAPLILLAHKTRHATPALKTATAPVFQCPSSPFMLKTSPHHLLGRLGVLYHVTERWRALCPRGCGDSLTAIAEPKLELGCPDPPVTALSSSYSFHHQQTPMYTQQSWPLNNSTTESSH